MWLLVRAGLEDADRWASVVGVFLNLAGVAIAAWGVVWARRAVKAPVAPVPVRVPGSGVVNEVKGGRAGSLVQARVVDLSGNIAPAGGQVAPGGVSNRVEDTDVEGLQIQGEVVRGPLPPAGDGSVDGRWS
ncbi:hypothetical protein [Actinorhabdospora filicis]|uniref:hypothetical protein n=1 Tax=Actinorhabdospora filicis TaxID=1785913 RepID=UPI0025525283|nr:hypothetical protein [Actinorhabdospora filicis]